LSIEENKYEPYFNLQVGDLVLDGEPLTNSQWQFYFDCVSDLTDKSPIYIVTGNHDYKNSTGVLAPGYLENFSFPQKESGSELFYTFDCGNICVIAAQIHPNAESDYLPGSEQFTFVTNKLATTDKPWKVFMTHNPVFSSRRSGVKGRDKWNTARASNMFKYYFHRT